MMKQLLFCAAILFQVTVYAQSLDESEVPSKVSGAFKAKFPNSDVDEWSMDTSKKYWVRFWTEDQESQACFDGKGVW